MMIVGLVCGVCCICDSLSRVVFMLLSFADLGGLGKIPVVIDISE